MSVEEFLRTIDEIRYDTDLDETNPELRGMAHKIYPYLRKMYNMMLESGLISESKVNEVHGVKKHNAPKDKRAAERKGNRDADREMYGDGFKPKSKIHNVKSYNRKDNKKFDINDINESVININENDLFNIVTESVKRILSNYGQK